MPALSIELTETEYNLLLTKAGKCDLQQITRIALDNYFHTHRHIATNTLPLDLSGRGKILAGLAADRIDPRKPTPPNRGAVMLDGSNRYETDEDYEAAMAAYRWQLNRYESEKAQFEEKKRNGTINDWGGMSWVN